MHAHFTGTHSHRHSETQTHATTIPTKIIVVSILLENVKAASLQGWFKLCMDCVLEVV